MKIPTLLIIATVLVTTIRSYGICPVSTLHSFDKQRGFVNIQAYSDDKTGMTIFGITTNPTTFFSHFRHAFPKERAQARVSLRAITTDGFKGPTVQLAHMKYNDPDLKVTFEIPSTDLNRYELEFDCSITWEKEDVPVIGGEVFKATLQAFRNSNEAVTENSPVYIEMHRRLEGMNGNGFGSKSKKANPDKATEQAATSNGDKPSN